MAEFNISARQVQRNDTAANWSVANPILLKSEIGVESDTGYFKFGDGINDWNSLEYSKALYSDYAKDTNTNTNFEFWIGSEEEYNALDPKSPNTLYFIR